MTAPNSWDRGSAIEGTVQPDEHRKILEISLDGYGLSKEAFGNAMVRAAEMKGSPLIMDRLMQGEGGALFSPIEASGEKCGYGKGVPGTTEFGHLLMQAGRYIDSDKVIIDRLIKSGEFEKLPTLVDALDRAKKGQGKLHLMGMITTKVVHASMEHVEEILRVAAARGLHGDQIYIHPWTDGRDEADNGIASFNQLEEMIRKYNVGVIVGTQGRGWGMDRDNRWDRITPAFRSMVEAFAAYFVRVKSSLERRAHYQREIPLSRHDALEDIVHWDEVNYSKLTKPVLTAVNIDSIVGGQLKNGDDSKIREAITEYGESDIPRVFVSHNGRPKREAVGTLSAKEMAKFSLGPAKMVIEKILAERGLTKTIKTTDGLSDPEVADMIKHLKPGEWLILGNYRFDPRASSNSPSERKMLARDIVFQGGQEPVFSMFENHDFASTHRTEKEGDPSTRLVDFTEFLPSVAGPHLLREVTQAEVIRNVNKHPYILSLGGVKVADKANIARNGISKMEQGDMVVLKGKLAYPFLAVQHEFGLPKMQLGSSGVFKDETEKNAAREIFRLAKVKGVKIILPVDHVIAHVADIKELTKETEVRTVGVGEAIPEGWIGLDIGPESVRVMGKAYRTARFIFENGAAGYFEDKRFENTFALYQLFPAAKKAGAIIYGGGGDTKSAIAKSKIPEDTFEYVSTSGGALMDYLGMPDGQDSPPIAALKAVAVQTRAALPLKESGQQALEAQQQYTSPPATPAADEGGHGDLPSIFGPSRPAALAAPFWEWLIAVPLLGSTIDAFLLLRRASHEGRQPTRAEWTNRLLSLASGIFWWYTGFFAQGSGFFFATFLWVIASASMFSNVHVGKTDKQYGDLFLQGVGLHLILFLPLLFASYFPGGLVHAIGSTQVLFIGIPIYLALHLAIVIARSTAWLPKHWALPPMLHPDDQQIGFRLTIDLRAA